jgi:hypothetical protein
MPVPDTVWFFIIGDIPQRIMVYALMEFVPARKGSMVRLGLGLMPTPRKCVGVMVRQETPTGTTTPLVRLACRAIPVQVLPDGESRRVADRVQVTLRCRNFL